MAKQFTGIDGELLADGNKVGRVSSWSFDAQVATLPTTTLGDFATTAIYGLQTFSGSCSVYYYETDAGAIDGAVLMTDAIRTTQTPAEPTHELILRYKNGATVHEVQFKCLLTSVALAASSGEIARAQISYQETGPLLTATIA